MTKIYYHQTHYLIPVGKPHWKWELNRTARMYVFLGISLAVHLLLSFVYQKLILMQNNIPDQAVMDELADCRRFVFYVFITGIVGVGILDGSPSMGTHQYSCFVTDIRIDEYGIKIQLGESNENHSVVYRWAWSCLWKNMKQIDFRCEPTVGLNGLYNMTVKGDACSLALSEDGTTKIVSPRKQKKIFGGKDQITIYLGYHISDIISALEHIETMENVKFRFPEQIN